jgi:imidazolonepropionase
MVAGGMIVALGSDFCPNAFCYSMPLTIHLACRNFGLLPNEAIVAATLNAAYSINRESMCGSIEVGKLGNFAILEGTEQRLAY